MKKIRALINYIYLSSLMIAVVALLLFSLARDSVVSFFDKKKSTQHSHAKNKTSGVQQKSSKYIIHS